MKQRLTHSISKEIAKRSATIAHSLTGWRKWVLAAIAAIAGAMAWFTQSGEVSSTSEINPSARPDTLVPAP